MFEEDVRKERKLSIDLEDKINDYIDWCSRNYSSEYATEVKEFIDDMTVWYEKEFNSSLIVFFKIALYASSCYPDISDLESFISSYETNYLKIPRYDTEKKLRLVDDCHKLANDKKSLFSITSEGRVRNNGMEQFELYNRHGLKVSKFEDVTVDEFVEWLYNKNARVFFEDIYYLCDEMQKYNRNYYFREGLLDSIMYNLIERGGSYYGIVKGYFFAKRFDRDKSIALTYGLLDMHRNNNEDKKMLIEDYLVNGGDINLECYGGYFNNDKNNIYTKKLFDVMGELGMNPEEAQEVARTRKLNINK